MTWQGTPRTGDLKLPITLGPLPTEPGRLQFKVVQTYDTGDVDHWIDEWPEGAPEPVNPGPVLDLVAGAPGSIPATSAPPAPTTTATTTPATTVTGDEAAADETDNPDTNPLVWLIPAAAVLAAGGGYAFLRSRRRGDTPS